MLIFSLPTCLWIFIVGWPILEVCSIYILKRFPSTGGLYPIYRGGSVEISTKKRLSFFLMMTKGVKFIIKKYCYKFVIIKLLTLCFLMLFMINNCFIYSGSHLYFQVFIKQLRSTSKGEDVFKNCHIYNFFSVLYL